MVCEGQDNNEGFSGLPLGCLRLCLQGFRKENCSDVVSKVCYPRCTGTVDRAHLGKDWPLLRNLQRWLPTWSAQLGICDQTILCGYSWSLSFSGLPWVPPPPNTHSLSGLWQSPLPIPTVNLKHICVLLEIISCYWTGQSLFSVSLFNTVTFQRFCLFWLICWCQGYAFLCLARCSPELHLLPLNYVIDINLFHLNVFINI